MYGTCPCRRFVSPRQLRPSAAALCLLDSDYEIQPEIALYPLTDYLPRALHSK